MNANWLALIVAMLAFLGSPVAIVLTGLQRRTDRRRDWDRQDLVAARLMERQNETAKRVTTTAATLVAANERLEQQTVANQEQTTGQLNRIHGLVNSTLTAAKRAELEAVEQTLMLTRRLIARDLAAGIKAAPEETASVDQLEIRIRQMRLDLDERIRQTTLGDAELEAHTKENPDE